nr:hypothetical protein [Tanacetum cinerariifolium]
INTATPTYANYPNDPLLPNLEDARIFDDAYDDRDEGAETDYNNLETVISVSPIPFLRIHKDYPKEHIIREFKLLNVWTLVDLPPGKKPLEPNGSIETREIKEGLLSKIKLGCNYAGASLDRKFTTGGCQFLGSRLISWQCKKQTIMANSTTEAEYIAASNCYGQTKHIEIRHHFIRDSYEKRLIEMVKILTDYNVIDLLTKAFDVTSQDKYVSDILKKFGFSSVKSASTPMETHKPLSKDAARTYVDIHLYRYLKGQPTLGLWYPKDLPLELIAYSNSNYAGASLDRKFTTGGCQFLGLTNKKELAIPGKTATGKELSNPLMAGSLPKTTLPTLLVLNVVSAIQLLLNVAEKVNAVRHTLNAAILDIDVA